MMKYYKKIVALSIGLITLSLYSCDGDTKTEEREVIVSADENLNLVGKIFGNDESIVKFEFVSETRVRISEPTSDDGDLVAGEYDYTIDKNEVFINLKSTFRNQSAAEAVLLFNNEITNNPTGELAVAYQNLVADALAGRQFTNYETYASAALSLFRENGVQVTLENSGTVIGLTELDAYICEKISLIIGQKSQVVTLQCSDLLLKNTGGLEERRDPELSVELNTSF